MHAYVARVFSCGRIRRHREVDACNADLGRHSPDWRRVLGQMDSLGIGTLRTPSDNETGFDGYHMVVETRDSDRYHTAYFNMSSSTGSGDTPRASAILNLLQAIGEAGARDSTSKRR